MEIPLYRLIAIDMDGTLLAPGHHLSQRTRTAVTSLIEEGRHVVVASGRPFEIVRRLCAGIPFAAPQISYNGAVVHDPRSGHVLSQSLVPPVHVPAVLDFLLGADLPVIACAQDAVYLDQWIANPEDWVPPSLEPGRFLPDMRAIPVEGLIKVVGESQEDATSDLRRLAEATFGQFLYVTQTSRTLLEFLNPTVSKGAALRRVADSLGVGRDEILAIGDSHNDLTMFEVAGLSIAMGNASDEVKEAADRVTLTNAEDGVAVALEDLGLLEAHRSEGREEAQCSSMD